jgi:hypothetical protein
VLASKRRRSFPRIIPRPLSESAYFWRVFHHCQSHPSLLGQPQPEQPIFLLFVWPFGNCRVLQSGI